MIHTLVSTDNSRYLHWQTQLLAWSHHKVGQPGQLTRLLSIHDPSTAMVLPEAHTYACRPASPDPSTQDCYPPYNKPASLAQWLRETKPMDETLLILDPDCLFLRPLRIEVRPGFPIAEPIFFMRPQEAHTVINRHCRKNNHLVQGFGVPMIIHRDDLVSFAPRWLELTREMRADKQTKLDINWIVEMWACSIAVAEVGLTFKLESHQEFLTQPYHGREIIHYSYDATNPSRTYHWSKREYNPWDVIPPPPLDVPETSRLFHRLISEMVEEQRSKSTTT